MTLSRRIATTIHHDQVEPSALWTIVHGLGDYPVVDAYVVFEGVLQKILPSAVTYVDVNTCTLTFTNPYSGYATVA